MFGIAKACWLVLVFVFMGCEHVEALLKQLNQEQEQQETAASTRVANKNGCWTQSAANPIIGYGQAIPGTVWNDPFVVKENGRYRMWLSGGVLRPMKGPLVNVYQAFSDDGIRWDIDKTVLIEPGPEGSWDSERIETPSVVKVNNTYHLYYCGCNAQTCPGGRYKIGHATSTDGKTWTKDPQNPVISYHADSDPFHWGFYTTAEPGAIYDARTKTIYLYYTTAKVRPGYEGDLSGDHGIALATSTDGSVFKPYDADHDGFADAVLTQSPNYPVTSKYVGYSTPMAFIDSKGAFHLFHDVVQFPKAGDYRQVALAEAVSNDGVNFTYRQEDIAVIGGDSWYSHEVRAPSVIEENGTFKMWYAGTGAKGVAGTGIGYATANSECQ